MWARFARVLSRHEHGLYLSDLHLGDDVDGTRGARAFTALLSVFARGKVHFHFADTGEAGRAVLAAGFSEARFFPAGRSSRSGRPPVQVLEAVTSRRAV